MQEVEIEQADVADAEAILALQRLAYQAEAALPRTGPSRR